MTRLTAAVLAGAALLIPARASAQGVIAGIEGGLAVTNVTLKFPTGTAADNGNPNPTSKNGLIIGGFVGKDFNAKGGLLIDVLYVQAGSKVEFSDTGFSGNQDIRVDYVQIPILGRFNFKASDKAVIHVFAGPAFSFKTSVSQSITVNGVAQPITPDDEIKLKSNDTGITLGASFDISRFLIDIRYTWGLMNINDTPNDNTEVKTRAFAVMFGVNLGKK
jgi:hypothetical protein